MGVPFSASLQTHPILLSLPFMRSKQSGQYVPTFPSTIFVGSYVRILSLIANVKHQQSRLFHFNAKRFGSHAPKPEGILPAMLLVCQQLVRTSFIALPALLTRASSRPPRSFTPSSMIALQPSSCKYRHKVFGHAHPLEILSKSCNSS